MPTELKPINSKVVVEIITWILRSSEGRLVCLGCCMCVEGAQSESVKGETAKREMASPRGGLGKPRGSIGPAVNPDKGKNVIRLGKRSATRA